MEVCEQLILDVRSRVVTASKKDDAKESLSGALHLITARLAGYRNDGASA